MTSENAELDAVTSKTYRSPVQDLLLPICGVLFLVVSPTPLSGGPGKGGTAGWVLGIVVAVAMAGIGLGIIVCQVSNRLLVADDGLTYRYNLRTRHVGWPDVQSVGTTPAKSMGSWWWLQVQTPGGETPIKSVMGTRKYVGGVAAEISALAADRRSDSPARDGGLLAE